MFNAVTFRLEGHTKALENALMKAMSDGKMRMFAVTPEGNLEVYVSAADHDGGHSEFHPRNAKKDKHAPHRPDHEGDGSVTFTIAPVPPS